MAEKKFEGTNSQYICKESDTLGVGGQGNIYKVQCIKTESLYALKLFNVFFNEESEERKKLAKREITLLEQLEHPSIPKIVDTAKKPEEFFYVMEYVKGESLRKQLDKKKKFSETEVLSYITDIAKVLNYIHSKNIAHRDIKPDNIILSANNTVNIVDFGIGKDVSSSITTEAYRGTKMYKPQSKPPAKKEDFYQDDIYSLGVTMYELLHGTPPWNPHQGVFPEVTANDFKVDISPKGKEICLKMLKVNRNLRYATTQELLQDIHNDSVHLPSIKHEHIVPNNKTLQYTVLGLLSVMIPLTYGFIYYVTQKTNNHTPRETNTKVKIIEETNKKIQNQYSAHFSSFEDNDMEGKILHFKTLEFEKSKWIERYKTYKSNLISEIHSTQKKHRIQANNLADQQKGNLELLLEVSINKVQQKFIEETKYMSQENHYLNTENMDFSANLLTLLIEESDLQNDSQKTLGPNQQRIVDLYTTATHNFLNNKDSSQHYKKAKKYYELALPLLKDTTLLKIGDLYYSGDYGIEQNYEKAKEYYKQAMDMGNGFAALRLGHMHHNGPKKIHSLPKALEYYNKALELEVNSYAFLIDIYKHRIEKFGLEDDLKKLLTSYNKAIQLTKKGKLLLKSTKTVPFSSYDYINAKHPQDLYIKAAFWDLYYDLGSLYRKGELSGLEKNYAKVVEYYTNTKFIPKKKKIVKYRDLGYIYLKGGYGIIKNIKKSETYFDLFYNESKSTAHHEDPSGISSEIRQIALLMGDIYATPTNQISTNYTKAITWYKRGLGRMGNKTFYNKLGMLYKQGGYGIDKNYTKAVEFFELARKKGHKHVDITLADLYQEGGYGIKQNSDRALYYYQQAFENGNREALLSIGDIYTTKSGGKVSPEYTRPANSDPNLITTKDLTNPEKHHMARRLLIAESYYQKAIHLGLEGEGYYKIAKLALQNNNETAHKSAVNYYLKALSSGNNKALTPLGNLYTKGGKGIIKNLKKAKKYYKQAEKLGATDVFYQLGLLYENESRTASNILKEFENRDKSKFYYFKASEHNHPEALYKVAEIYRNDLSFGPQNNDFSKIKEDINEIKKYYIKSLEKGYYDKAKLLRKIARFHLRYIKEEETIYSQELINYFNSVNTITHNNITSISNHYIKAIKENEAGDFYHLLGDIYNTGENVQQNYEKAKIYYTKAAKLENTRSLNALGLIYQHGNGVDKNPRTARWYYIEAITRGHVGALYNLGNLLYSNNSSSKDYSIFKISGRAVTYFYEAAKKGNTSATYSLAKILHKTQKYTKKRKWSKAHPELDELESSRKKAIKYYEEGRKPEDIDTLLQLGLMYETGTTYINANFKKAKNYYEQAVSKGHTNALYNLGHLHHYTKSNHKNFTKALLYYQNFLENQTEDTYALNTVQKILALENIGDIYKKGGYNVQVNYFKSLQYYKKAAAVDKEIFKKLVIKNIAELHYSSHKEFHQSWLESIKLYENSAYKYDVSAALKLIKICLSTKQYYKALEHCKVVLNEFEDFPPIDSEYGKFKKIKQLHNRLKNMKNSHKK